MARIEIRDLNKAYGAVKVLKNINLDVTEGEFVVLVGPSGCGKSTLLRTIAGLETADSGNIRFNGTNVVNSAPQERNVSMVFQTYALYPHLSVRENISYGLKVHKIPKPEIARRVAEAAEILQLEDYLDRRPAQLSGGQRQRVAMARAMVREPVVFLYDEPLSNLDAYLRVAMRLEIKSLHGRLKRTSIYVTHDQVEAMTMGDRIVVMKDGVIRQVGTPLELYDDPSDVFVASFIGSPPMNIIDTEVRDGALWLNGSVPMQAPDHIMAAIGSKTQVKLGLRPEQLRADRHVDGIDADDHDLHFSATVESRDELGQDIMIRADLGGELMTIRTDRQVPSTPGTTIDIALAAKFLRLFDPKTEQRMPIEE